ncbi:MAG: hypothetical protein NNA30_12620, partial [Nitrospira sp.]|nr:hypothetical protein [Nitrospira sp.]
MTYSITKDEFRQFQKLIYDKSGIALSDQKESLLVARLMRRLRELGLQTFSQYYELVINDQSGDEFTRMLDLVST